MNKAPLEWKYTATGKKRNLLAKLTIAEREKILSKQAREMFDSYAEYHNWLYTSKDYQLQIILDNCKVILRLKEESDDDLSSRSAQD